MKIFDNNEKHFVWEKKLFSVEKNANVILSNQIVAINKYKVKIVAW